VWIPARRSLLRLLVLAAVAPVAFAACGGNDSSSSPTTPDDLGTFGFLATRRCTDLINGIDHEVARAGNRARLEMVFAAVEDADEPDDATKAAWTAAMEARRAQLVALQDELAALGSDADEASRAAWDTVVAAGDREIALLDSRLVLLDGDWATATSTIEPDDGPSEADSEAIDEALQALDIGGRDCRHVFVVEGNPPEHAEFLTSASSTCATIVTRRFAGYGKDDVLDGVEAAVTGGDVAATDELAAAVDASLAEWQATAEDFAGVVTADVPDREGWQLMVDLAADRVQGFERRAAALASGDQTEINAAFQPEAAFDILVGTDLAALQVQNRDCWLVEI
jgi:hypothetical protein